MSSVACQRARDVGQERQDGTTGCYGVVLACAYQVPPSTTVWMNVYKRLKKAKAGTPWQFVRTTCNPERYGVVAPPRAPTFGQIQTAFKSLPFAKPSVHIQPEGNVTLVNLPTFYEVKWPAAGLAAGEDSAPITLLGWTIRFRIEAHDYTYRFGDGTSSAPTTDPGGVYPSGRIRHTYARAGSAQVKVDTRLSGKVSINGGPWEPIHTVADLQGEPVTTLSVRTATNRLVQ